MSLLFYYVCVCVCICVFVYYVKWLKSLLKSKFWLIVFSREFNKSFSKEILSQNFECNVFLVFCVFHYHKIILSLMKYEVWKDEKLLYQRIFMFKIWWFLVLLNKESCFQSSKSFINLKKHFMLYILWFNSYSNEVHHLQQKKNVSNKNNALLSINNIKL